MSVDTSYVDFKNALSQHFLQGRAKIGLGLQTTCILSVLS